MASAIQRINSEDTLREKDLSNIDMPETRNSEYIASSNAEKPDPSFENNIDNTSAYKINGVAPDVEKAQNHPDKRKLPSIFSPQLKKDRIILLKAVIKVEILLMAIILGILSIYWGGLASIEPNQRVLTVAVVDFDGQEVGNAFTSAGYISGG